MSLSASHSTQNRRARKRDRMLDHLATKAFHLFEAYGYDAVTMERIAQVADVAKGTLYNHFPVKEALLAHLFHNELAEGIVQLQETLDAQRGIEAKLRYLLNSSADWCATRRIYLPHYFRFRFMYTRALSDSFSLEVARSGIDQIYELLITAGQAAGELRQDIPASQLTTLFQHLHLGALMRWLDLPDLNLHEEFDAIVTLFIHGAGNPLTKRENNEHPHT